MPPIHRSLPLAVGVLASIALWQPHLSSQTVADLPALLGRYALADADAAVREFAAWSPGRVEREALANVPDDGWKAARLALFHLEADLARISLEPTPENNELRAPIHRVWARKLLFSVAIPAGRRADDRQLLAFCRDWYVVDQIFVRRAVPMDASSPSDFMPNDAAAHLLAGVGYSSWIGPRRSGRGPYASSPLTGTTGIKNTWMSWRGEEYDSLRVRDTQVELERAIALDASLAEAHLRLGRLFQLIGRERDAQRELELIATLAPAATDSDTRYLAHLFLGQMFEDQDDLPAAIAAYDRALLAYAPGSAARLAKGRALFTMGQPSQAWESMRSVFGADALIAGARPMTAARDPWVRYPPAAFLQVGPTLARMRARVSNRPLREHPRAILAELPTATADATVASPRAPGAPGFRVDAIVREGNAAVEGLTASDFVISGGLMPVKVVDAKRTDSLSIAFVVDASSSVSDAETWAQVKDVATRAARALSAGDVASFVLATERPTLLADLVKADALIGGPIAALKPFPEQRTALWDSVAAAASLVAEGPGRPVVLVISDGFDNSSWLERRRALKMLEKLGVAVDAITVSYNGTSGGVEDIANGDIALDELKGATGGEAWFSSDKSLGEKLAARFATLRSSYAIRFDANDPPPGYDGWQDLKLRLRPGLKGKVEARAGYFKRTK